jgi:hypothetical protein
MPKRQGYPRKPFKTTPGAVTPLRTRDVCLLSLERCRALLPQGCEITDLELERLRDGLYALAGVAVDGYLARRVVPVHPLRQIDAMRREPQRNLIAIRESSSVEGERN